MKIILRSPSDRKALHQFWAIVRTVRWALKKPKARCDVARAALLSVRVVHLRALVRWCAETAFMGGDAALAGRLDALADWCGAHGREVHAMVHALFDPPQWAFLAEGEPDAAAFLDALFSPADRQSLLLGGSA